jgi:hypothetical protein
VLVAAAGLAGLLMVATALLDVSPYCGIGVLVAGVLAVVLNPDVSAKRTDELVVADGGFVTRGGSVATSWALVGWAAVTETFIGGVHEPGDPLVPWLAVLVAYAAPLAACAYGLWHGVGTTLAPGGLRLVKLTGAVHVPWEALATTAYRQDADPDNGRLILNYADPALITTSGRPLDIERAPCVRTRRDFLAAVIRHYIDNPADRAAIGSTTEYHRRRTIPQGTGAGELPAIPPASGRRRIRNALAGSALAIGSVALHAWSNAALDNYVSLGVPVIFPPLIGGLALLFGALSRKSPSAALPPAPAPPPSRAPWSRDVTNG